MEKKRASRLEQRESKLGKKVDDTEKMKNDKSGLAVTSLHVYESVI